MDAERERFRGASTTEHGMAAPSATAVSSATRPGERKAAPGDVDLARRHAEVVLARQEERTVLVDLEVSARVRDLARHLGHSGAGPREAALLHHRALRALTDPQPATRARVLHEAGQTVLIELLGELAAFYRELALDEPPPHNTHGHGRALAVAGAWPPDPGSIASDSCDHAEPDMEEPA